MGNRRMFPETKPNKNTLLFHWLVRSQTTYLTKMYLAKRRREKCWKLIRKATKWRVVGFGAFGANMIPIKYGFYNWFHGLNNKLFAEYRSCHPSKWCGGPNQKGEKVNIWMKRPWAYSTNEKEQQNTTFVPRDEIRKNNVFVIYAAKACKIVMFPPLKDESGDLAWSLYFLTFHYTVACVLNAKYT